MNQAIDLSTGSSKLFRDLAPRALFTQSSPLRPSPLGDKHPLQVGRISENAGALHGGGALGTRRHRPSLFQGGCRFQIQIKFGPRIFVVLSHGSQWTG
jgi:hypothetical protein